MNPDAAWAKWLPERRMSGMWGRERAPQSISSMSMREQYPAERTLEPHVPCSGVMGKDG